MPETLYGLAEAANLSLTEARARLKGLTANHIRGLDILSEADASMIRAALAPEGYTDCGCDPSEGHAHPCLLAACKGCGSTEHGPLGGTLKCADCVGVDIHNYRALHDGRYKTRQYPTRKVQS